MKRLAIILGIFFLSSCVYAPPASYVEGESRYVTASWYGPKFHGRPTSSGERFNMYGLTCAHKTLKFGTRLRVTNPENNKSVIVTVNDRGPFIRGRELDLSYGAAKAIDFVNKGVGKVRVDYLGRDIRYARRITFSPLKVTGPLSVQVGSFTEPSNAFRLKRGLELRYKDVYITSAYLKGEKYYRVRIGRFKTYVSAYSVAEKLADEGYDILITSRN